MPRVIGRKEKQGQKMKQNTPSFELQECGQHTLGLVFLIRNKKVMFTVQMKK